MSGCARGVETDVPKLSPAFESRRQRSTQSTKTPTRRVAHRAYIWIRVPPQFEYLLVRLGCFRPIAANAQVREMGFPGRTTSNSPRRLTLIIQLILLEELS